MVLPAILDPFAKGAAPAVMTRLALDWMIQPLPSIPCLRRSPRGNTTANSSSVISSRSWLMSLADLVQAKKTQRDKDWPMIRRLVEVHYFGNRESAHPAQRRFWLMELRTPELLIELASIHPNELRRFKRKRLLLGLAQTGNESALADAILEEERAERRIQPLSESFERRGSRRVAAGNAKQ